MRRVSTYRIVEFCEATHPTLIKFEKLEEIIASIEVPEALKAQS
jgi:hypothetical protein